MTRLSIKTIAACICTGAALIGLSGCHSQPPPPPPTAAAPPPVSLRSKGEAKMRAEAAAFAAQQQGNKTQ